MDKVILIFFYLWTKFINNVDEKHDYNHLNHFLKLDNFFFLILLNIQYNNHLSYFYKFTNFLNQWRYDSHKGIQDNCVDPFKIMKHTSNIFEITIDKIEYGCSYIAIYKKSRYHWI